VGHAFYFSKFIEEHFPLAPNLKYVIYWDNCLYVEDSPVYQIRALRDIPRWGVKALDWGGYISGEDNLLQEGDCWVAETGAVYDNGRVGGHALVSSGGSVGGRARVGGYSRVILGAEVYGNAVVSGDSEVSENAIVRGSVNVNNRIVTGIRTIEE